MKKMILKQWLFLFLLSTILITACDDDDGPVITDFNAELSVTTQGDETDLTSIIFTVTLSGTNHTGQAISFDFNTTTDGTATAAEDYTAITDATANLTIADGASTGTITVEILQDTEYEETETVVGQISNASYEGVTITTAEATANIEDDDIYANGVFITNEGNFGSGNGSVSYYSFNADEVTNDVFQTVNERALGDVVQSLTVHNDMAYIVVNGSGKIEVAAYNNFKEQGVVTGLSSPRYFVGINDTKGYVSEWGTGMGTDVKVIDLSTLTVTKTITVGTGPEHLIYHNNYVYVANSGGYGNDNTVSVIDPSTDAVVKTITLDADSPRDFAIDANGDLWVLCYGYITYDPVTYEVASETASKLVRINTTTNEVAQTITISETLHPACLEASKNGNNLFYGGGYGFQGLYKIKITDTTVPATPLIDKSFYGFNVNPETGNIFACDAGYFTANGTLYRYDGGGTELGSYEVGIGPNGTGTSNKRSKK